MGIETWKAIAFKVKQLDFEKETEQEFQDNLATLNRILRGLGIEDNIGERTPNSADEIGTASLLQSIQDINVPNNYKKATFYEKISQLVDLGIQEIKFCSKDSYGRLPDLVRMTLKENIVLQKYYTDGTFQLREASIGNKYIYNLYNLCDVNYALITTLNQSLTAEERYSITHETSQIILSSFNGFFPSKKEIMKFEFPELAVAKQRLIWGESPRVKEKFETFNREEASYQKSLKRD